MLFPVKILATVGPSCFNPATIKAMSAAGVDMFRINLSHTSLKDLNETINVIKAGTQKPICLDTEGAQIRTKGYLNGKVTRYYPKKMVVRLMDEENPALNAISLYPKGIIEQLQPNDVLFFGADAIPVKLIESEAGSCLGVIGEDLYVRGNMAVTSRKGVVLSCLTKKDDLAVKIARRKNIGVFALSYARRQGDLVSLHQLLNFGLQYHVIAKVENKQGILNLDGILKSSDSILIDRGDMGKEISPLKVPWIQKAIIRKVRKAGKPVYVATNLLESMVERKRPTAAEMNDVYNTLCDGADGLVLAAETAIGKYPVECVKMVKSVIGEYLKRHVKN